MVELYDSISALVAHAQRTLLLSEKNVDYAINAILDLLGLESFSLRKEARVAPINELLDDFAEAATSAGIFPPDLRERYCDGVVACLMLQPQQVQRRFDSVRARRGSKAAMQWLYDYSINSDYVKKAALDANPRFESNGLIVTVNRTKPEFADPKKAVSGNAVKGGYPKCSICHANEGFGGRNKRTLRTVDITLDGEKWFWQFSPYGYFSQHGIAVNYRHVPMRVDRSTFRKLMDFTDMFPHYFIGCNAPLERIGGSVLAHDHFQGGGETLPMHKAAAAYTLRNARYPQAIAEVVDWYGTVLRVVSADRTAVEEACDAIREKWESYEDLRKGIVPRDEHGQHNAVSPTVVKTSRGYEMSVILRSNVTSAEYPDGVFHAHPEFHAIKRESIGLIEAQGLFILPGRLYKQLGVLADALTRALPLPEDMAQFCMVYEETAALMKDGIDAKEAIRRELGSVCTRILCNTAVFDKEDSVKFLTDLGWRL